VSSSQEPGREEGPDEQSGPTIRDRRRIDPTTYERRDPVPAEAPAEPAVDADAVADESSSEVDEVAELTAKIAERTEDLQRLQAEYVNYKRRVDRDRDQARTLAVQAMLNELLPVLDSIGHARDHGELTGGFKAVADELEKVTSRHGLEVYGEAGDAFDPHIHEALMHAPGTADLTGPTCVQVLQPGYRVGDRILRPARVAVAEPVAEQPDQAAEPEA